MITEGLRFLGTPFKEDAFTYLHSLSQGFAQNPDIYKQFLDDYGKPILGHNGYDSPRNEGTPYYATHDGRITKLQISDTYGYGVYILDETPRKWLGKDVWFRTSNWHAKSFIPGLQLGQSIKEGDLLGYVDSTGFSTGHHDHFGLQPFLDKGATIKMFPFNGYNGYVDLIKFFKGYAADPTTKILGTYDLPDDTMLKLVLLGSEQYLRDKEGNDYHIYNVATLNALFSAGIIDTLVPAPVSSVKDIGKEFVILTRE